MKNTNTNTNWSGLWTLEWNEKQEKFHIESANDRFHLNKLEFIDGTLNHWSMLGVFNSFKEAENYADMLRYSRKTKLAA